MCTSIALNSKDGSIIHGRTNEFIAEFNSEAIFRPRFFKHKSDLISRTDFEWENKYSYIGFNCPGIIKNKEFIIDGMNEMGLSGSILYFYYHEYKKMDLSELKSHNIQILNFVSYIIGNYKNIEEIKKDHDKINKMFYWEKGTSSEGYGIHISLVDADGSSLVVEPENGNMVFKENPLRVLANSSPLEYHYENLRKYSHLISNEIPQTMLFPEMPNFKDNIIGNGLFGLPGDFSSDSRFVRASILSQIVDEGETAEETVNIVFRILHTADLISGMVTEALDDEAMKMSINMYPGTIKLQRDSHSITDVTDNVLVKDLTNLKVYYKTKDNLTIRFIDLNKIKNNTKESLIKIDKDNIMNFHEVKL